MLNDRFLSCPKLKTNWRSIDFCSVVRQLNSGLGIINVIYNFLKMSVKKNDTAIETKIPVKVYHIAI